MPLEIDQQQNFLGVTAPARRAFAVTPNDGADLAVFARGLYIGGSGNVKVTTTQGDEVTFIGMLGGSVYPVRVKRVWSTGTTATNIVGLA